MGEISFLGGYFLPDLSYLISFERWCFSVIIFFNWSSRFIIVFLCFEPRLNNTFLLLDFVGDIYLFAGEISRFTYFDVVFDLCKFPIFRLPPPVSKYEPGPGFSSIVN